MKYLLQMSDNQEEKIIINAQKLERLRVVMKKMKYKDDIDLAKAINISQAYMSEIFSGKKNVPKTMGQKLEDSIGISRRWFENGVGEAFLVTVDGSEINEYQSDKEVIDQLKMRILEKDDLIAEKDKRIADKDEIISMLKEKLALKSSEDDLDSNRIIQGQLIAKEKSHK